MLNETTIKAFLVLAELGSFTEAGKQMYLSQQAVSKQIAKMEQDLGCTLFRRERGKLSLTGAGRIYYEAFSKIADIYNEAQKEAEKVIGSWDKTLYIGVPELLDMREMTQGLNEIFREQNPDIKLVFRSAPQWTVLNQLERGELDAVFTFSRELELMEWPEAIFIKEMREMLVISADHPKAKPNASYMDFENETVFYTPVPANDDDILHHMQELRFPSDHLVPTENFMSSMANVEQGEGVLFMLENCRMLQGSSLTSYPTNIVADLMLAYRPDIQKRCARRYLKIARELFDEE